MNVLITGGAGFIGSHIAEHFHRDAEVRVLDNLRTGHAENLDGLDVTWINASILDREAVREAMRDVDYVFHLAALVSVQESIEQPDLCREINVTGLEVVLEAAADAGAKKLCFASSAAVYGNDPVIPKLETMSPAPLSPYASTKLDGEALCAQYAQAGKLATTSLRFFNVFGPRQDPGSTYAAAVPIFIHQARNNQPISIFGDGEQTRDFVYVKDVASAMAFAAEHPEMTGVYNLGYGQRMSINELAQTIIETLGSRATITHAPERAGDIKHSLASPEKIRSAGFVPTYSVTSGLQEMLVGHE